jgi:hypothetical protein
MASKIGRIRTISVHEQLAHIKNLWPYFKCTVKGGQLICRGIVQPLSITESYRIRIEYRARFNPKVIIEEPPLRQRQKNESIPHTYEENRPCIFHPHYNEWRSDKTIATTIIPWLLEWLVYYEAWLATGEWQGGGEHPSNGKKNE